MGTVGGEDWLRRKGERWRQRVDALLARRRIAAALRVLDRIIEDKQLELFDAPVVSVSNRQLAWMFKIDVLRTAGRYREALAWACMECEINPNNITAQATKEELKRRLASTRALAPPTSGAATCPDDIWEGVAGMHALKAALERDVILPILHPALYRRYRLSLPNGVLLHGPPGCGKTFIAQKLGRILGFHFINVKPSDLGSIYVHGSQLKIGQLFKDAERHAPSLLFLDELDALLPNRSGDLYHHYAAEVNEFLTQLNGAADRRVLVVGATNRIDRLDAAAIRPGRFDKKVYVGLPDLEARVELFRLYMADRPQTDIDYVKVGRESGGYTCAELEHVVNEAARRALERRRPIGFDDLMRALAANPAAHAREPHVDDQRGS